jgi:hypothetical protein
MASPLAAALMMPGGNAQGALQPTNVTAAYQLSTDAAEKNYQAKLAQQNAMWGGLAGLGSAGIIASPKLFGAGGPFAPGGAASSYATTADAGLGGVGTGGFNAIDAAAPSVASGVADATAPVAADAFAAGAPVAADLAATAAPAAADAAAGTSIADLLPFLATLFA